MASEAIRPHIVGFLDLMLKEEGRTLRLEEVAVPDASPWAGRSWREIDLYGKFNLLPVAIKPHAQAEQKVDVNPPDRTVVPAGAVLIVMGNMEDVYRARREAAP